MKCFFPCACVGPAEVGQGQPYATLPQEEWQALAVLPSETRNLQLVCIGLERNAILTRREHKVPCWRNSWKNARSSRQCFQPFGSKQVFGWTVLFSHHWHENASGFRPCWHTPNSQRHCCLCQDLCGWRKVDLVVAAPRMTKPPNDARNDDVQILLWHSTPPGSKNLCKQTLSATWCAQGNSPVCLAPPRKR